MATAGAGARDRGRRSASEPVGPVARSVRRPGQALIGCSGWLYASWRGPFYPAALPISDWLPYYASRFATVEINNTFYRLPEKRVFSAWRDATPPGFTVAVKASRYLTHLKRLRQPGPPLDRLYRRCFALGDRLGPILYQLPESMQYDPARLTRFLRALRVQGRRALQRNRRSHAAPRVGRLRHVLEFRNPTWYRSDVFQALRRAHVGLCMHDMPGSAIADDNGGGFVYVRFHGTTGKYQGSYSSAVLKFWAGRIREATRAGRDAYAYFNNDIGGTAVENARALIGYVHEG
jgi:uncharacterized protein YecE (DUF72 family)